MMAAPEWPEKKTEDDRWKDLHEYYVSLAKSKEPEVIIFGDDHVALLEQANFYRAHLAPLHCLVLGALGDTADLLEWRISNGELSELPVKIVVISIGHNDVLVGTPDELLARLQAIVESVCARQPNAAVFVMKLFPMGRTANARRVWIDEVNGRMEDALSGTRAAVVDVDPSILQTDSRIDAHLMFDFFHLTQEGYNKMFEPLLVALTEHLNP